MTNKCVWCKGPIRVTAKSKKRRWHERCKHEALAEKRRREGRAKLPREQQLARLLEHPDRLRAKAAAGKELSPDEQRSIWQHERAVELYRREALTVTAVAERTGLSPTLAAQLRAVVGLPPCTREDWL